MQKKPRKKITNASRRARSSSVLSVSSTTSSVTPASRPISVPCVAYVPASVNTKSSSSQALRGRLRALSASQPRHSSTAAAPRLHHSGKRAACGNSTQAITASKNSVSRPSRGNARKVASVGNCAVGVNRAALAGRGGAGVSMWPAPPGNGVCGLRRWRA